jgi:hypothetical protein
MIEVSISLQKFTKKQQIGQKTRSPTMQTSSTHIVIVNPTSRTTITSRTFHIARPEYSYQVRQAFKRYMILYEYNDEEDREYDEDQEVNDDMIDDLLITLRSRGIDNPLEKNLVRLLQYYWNMYTQEEFELF